MNFYVLRSTKYGKDKIYDKVSKIMLDTFEKTGFNCKRYSEVTCKDVPQDIMDDILNILLEEKQIVKINDEMYTLTSYMETAKEKIKEHLKEDPLITIAQVRDMFETSRKVQNRSWNIWTVSR